MPSDGWDCEGLMQRFTIVRCIESGLGFVRGDTYPLLGWNNGHYIFREDSEGNPFELLVHTFCSIDGSDEPYEFADAMTGQAPRFVEETPDADIVG